MALLSQRRCLHFFENIFRIFQSDMRRDRITGVLNIVCHFLFLEKKKVTKENSRTA
jgi:hypothetical protein